MHVVTSLEDASRDKPACWLAPQAPPSDVVCCCRNAPLQGSSNQYCCCGNAAECCQSDSFCASRNCINIVILSLMAVLIAAGILMLWFYRRVRQARCVWGFLSLEDQNLSVFA